MSRVPVGCVLAALPALAQDHATRQIILEVQKRQHSDSQRYEGTLEVTSQGNQRGHQALGVPAHRIVRKQQGDSAIHGSGRSEGCRAC